MDKRLRTAISAGVNGARCGIRSCRDACLLRKALPDCPFWSFVRVFGRLEIFSKKTAIFFNGPFGFPIPLVRSVRFRGGFPGGDDRRGWRLADDAAADPAVQ